MGFERKIRLKAVFTFTAVAFLWVIFSYLVVIFLVRGASNWDDIYSFITRYASWGIWGKGNLETLPTSVRSLLLTQSFSFLRWELTFNGIFAILASSSTILVLLGGIWGWVSTLEKGKDWKLSWGWMAATSVIAVVFINWWQADGWDFWVLPWTLVMLGWAKLKTPNKYITSASLAAFIIIIGLFNLNRLVLPRTEETANPYYDVLITLKNNQESNCYELLTANPHLWRYAYYWGRITNAEFIATESDGNFSSESQKKITRRLLAYNASSEDRPLLVDKPIHDYLISSIAIKPVLSGFVNQNTKPVAQATFEGIDLDIYKIQKP